MAIDRFGTYLAEKLTKNEMDIVATMLWNGHHAIYNSVTFEPGAKGISLDEAREFGGEIASLAATFDICAGW